MTRRHHVGPYPPCCCECKRKQRPDEPEDQWGTVPIGGDAYADRCPECSTPENPPADHSDAVARETDGVPPAEKHTPGPWRTEFTGTGWTINYNGPDHRWLVAEVNETPAIGHHGANADLIAAAPTLLAACKDVIAYGTKGQLPDGRWARDVLLAAISKATGKGGAS